MSSSLFAVKLMLRVETGDSTTSVGIEQRVSACNRAELALVRNAFEPALFDRAGVNVDSLVGGFEVVDRERVALRSCAVARSRQSFVALYLTNNYLLFQFRGSSAHQSRVCKLVPWLAGDAHRIVGMDVNEVRALCLSSVIVVVCSSISLSLCLCRQDDAVHFDGRRLDHARADQRATSPALLSFVR